MKTLQLKQKPFPADINSLGLYKSIVIVYEVCGVLANILSITC
jgi:hypothetical protein